MSEWGAPQNLVWFWAVPSAIALFIVASLRARGQMKRFGDVLMIRKLVSSLSPARRWFKRTLILLALASMVAALCQPHFSKKEVTVDRQGVDVVIALDVSRSMLAKDMSPNRLEKAKLELTDLVGLDVRLAILDHLHRELGEQFRPPVLLRQMVRAGRLGRKSGRGFYEYPAEPAKKA